MTTPVLILIEVLIVIGLSRLMGQLCRTLKQPLVIGEIIAGIMLGPSLLGLIAPDLAVTLFPPETIPYLDVLAQIGLVFFMFLIGLELNPKYLKGQLDKAILISHVSILVPFALGSILALLLYPLVSSQEVSFTAFSLFLGSAMSITAFPVLARIITENNLQKSKLGTLALTCAAVDDVTAWCLLAIAIAVTRTNSFVGAIPTIVEALIYIAFMMVVVRWLLKKLEIHYQRRGKLTPLLLAWIYMGVVVSALITELIGIHLIFGAFLLGAVMPKNEGLVQEIAEKTEDFVIIFLLPIFFAYSGLKTQIGLLNRPILWLLCGAVLTVAIIGKYIGTYVAARVSGVEKRDASALGWLMNTRGLTELIVLNIGLKFGVISPLLFTMLVIMALVTTLITSPILESIYPKRLIRLNTTDTEIESTEKQVATYKILVPVANPNSQAGLLQLAGAISGEKGAVVHPLSLIELEEDYLYQSTPEAADQLVTKRREQIEKVVDILEPESIRKSIVPIVGIAQDVAEETAEIATNEQANLTLVGWHRSAFTQNSLGGRVRQILNNAPTDVAVFVEQKPYPWQSLLVAYANNIHDDLALSLGIRMLFSNDQRQLKIIQLAKQDPDTTGISSELWQSIETLPESVRSRIEIAPIEPGDPMQAVIQASAVADLTIVGTSRAWGIERQTVGRYTDKLAKECESSILITHRYNQVAYHINSLIEEELNNSSVV
ncbi:sodium:proton antiporter [Pleurocapsa sp. CCALA 161]|uniref:cation:proton antiporter n=1 Tax=Pleurocapsa sp. CCALA 161 TaxID=2107688 RepID=UPI000D080B13|nr:cation:proton antiporter [Pleurocapsa sp. CCALA 161]PSB10258.1 sodium:proton antiporter [Pleurocapsa sp. CCALA 161]